RSSNSDRPVRVRSAVGVRHSAISRHSSFVNRHFPGMTAQQHPRMPSSTYRLQFNRQFTFTDAREIVPYLDALGIRDCYASPYFEASAESIRGYDITDHNNRNGAIGAREDCVAWYADPHAEGVGLVVDFVLKP